MEHCPELPDIKRALVEFFGTLSRKWALGCMKDLLLVTLRGNLQIIVQIPISVWLSTIRFVAKEYSEQLGVDACIKLFEQFKSNEVLYFLLGSHLSSNEDPQIHFRYIEVATKTGQIKEVERVTRESNIYDPEDYATKLFWLSLESLVAFSFTRLWKIGTKLNVGASSSSIFETLQLGKPLIVVVNEDLMDNHQRNY
ncbi:unnamed protein product [Thlaspi arvense]|uniref:Glycosyl transferase family 28 C-terminal domain-containing protein n=1 Tax=Thlaspi arvense TaxID=13288 RepID=A0AAU9RRZ6_THLAR|nr:unnamed protein product [Thlaspi arvense]